ncbi:DUF501 domain-containing protein [Planctomycetota bacterium]|nr:DUF501 domain-containing protein [Planctomycetota bacterium]
MLTDHDANLLKQQLGRMPRGVVRVVIRTGEGEPVVIENYPVHHCGEGHSVRCDGGEKLIPFPTLYWLTSPRLSVVLSDMERRGAIDQLQQKIMSNGELEHQVADDHRAYINKRWDLLTQADRKVVEASPTLLETLRARGIGGISNFLMIKCLHLHYAHHLAALCCDGNGSAVGRLIEEIEPELVKMRQRFTFE